MFKGKVSHITRLSVFLCGPMHVPYICRVYSLESGQTIGLIIKRYKAEGWGSGHGLVMINKSKCKTVSHTFHRVRTNRDVSTFLFFHFLLSCVHFNRSNRHSVGGSQGSSPGCSRVDSLTNGELNEEQNPASVSSARSRSSKTHGSPGNSAGIRHVC